MSSTLDTQNGSLLSPQDEQPVIRPAAPKEGDLILARRRPPGLWLGLSAWDYPGWSGLIYRMQYTQEALAHGGLRAIGQHPLLNAAGLEHSYHGPLAEGVYADYAAQVPAAFRFMVMAVKSVTNPILAAPAHVPNPEFLKTEVAIRELIAPATAGLGSKLGVIIFQLPRMNLTAHGGTSGLLKALGDFFASLPFGPRYALEVHNRELLCREYRAMLNQTGVAHVYSGQPFMPTIRQQAALIPVTLQPALIVRWLVNQDLTYARAKEHFSPYNRLLLAEHDQCDTIARLLQKATKAGMPCFVSVGNNAEGSAPLSARRLLHQVETL